MRADALFHARVAASLVVAMLSLSFSSPALAAPAGIDGAKAALADGDRAFQLGRFEEAIDAYERAFGLDPQPAFLFNIGLAHRRQYQIDGRIEHLLRARELYRNYLKLDPTGPHRAGVEKVLGELDAQIEDARRHAAPGLTPPPAAPPPTEPASPARVANVPPPMAPPLRIVAPATGTPPPVAEPAPSPSSNKRWWIIGGAAAAVIIAVAAILIANRGGSGFDGPGVDLTPKN